MLSIVCTMLDHDGPIAPMASSPGLWAGSDLAALHRELAANVPWAGIDAQRAGGAADRNVVLRIPVPFPIERMLGA
jgi:hypothetical protein